MKHIKHLHHQQKGIVSFFVVVIIMIVLSLIVLAFAQLVRREQRQTLDRQLSTQAFYAAESGVNDAIDALTSDASLADWDDDCDGFTNDAGLTSDLGNGVSYSCLLVDNSPPELRFGSLSTSESVVVPIESEGGDAINTIEVLWDDWDDPSRDADCSGGTNTFPGRLDGSCQVGSLRIELVPFGSPKDRSQLVSDRFIGFFMPGSGGLISRTYAQGTGDNQGVKGVGGCSGSEAPRCTLRITGLPGDDLYYLRMRSIYRDTAVTIRSYTGSSATEANRVDMVGAQATIDSTGRAADVLRRIKVYWPLDSEGTPSPEFALQSADTMCKRFSISPPAFLEYYGGLDECDPTLDP